MKRAFWLRKFGRITILVGVTFLLSVSMYWMISRLFTITSIEVVGTGLGVAVDPDKLPTKNILFFPVQTVITEILAQNPTIATIVIKKKYPHTLVVLATPRQPRAIVGLAEPFFLIDKEGVVLEGDPSVLALPAIRIGATVREPGNRVADTWVRDALSFIVAVEDIVEVASVREMDSASLGAVSGTMNIFFPHNADALVIARTLQTIIAGFRIKGTLPQMIDLRFDKPVVKI